MKESKLQFKEPLSTKCYKPKMLRLMHIMQSIERRVWEGKEGSKDIQLKGCLSKKSWKRGEGNQVTMALVIDEKSSYRFYTPSMTKFKPKFPTSWYGLLKKMPRHVHAQLVNVKKTDVYVIFRSVNGSYWD